nr:hypothetical protein [Clostridium sp. Marseille-P7770]
MLWWEQSHHGIFYNVGKEGRCQSVTDEEVAVTLGGHDHEIKSLKHRMDRQEEQGKTLNSLALSVQELAISMKSMIEEQKNQGERLAKLEAEPGETWGRVKHKVLDTLVGAGAGALAIGLINMMSQYVK